jgi:hypothetical protein
MQVYLDCVPFLYDPPDLNSFPVHAVAGVEAYCSTAQVPGEFGEPRDTCGVLLLWSREIPWPRTQRVTVDFIRPPRKAIVGRRCCIG